MLDKSETLWVIGIVLALILLSALVPETTPEARRCGGTSGQTQEECVDY